ncbi:MAG: hypothetical protein IJH79_05210 [Lentisphaeria bacterium]|nr:hypothetical protein [Lentisphaeria bacterium]
MNPEHIKAFSQIPQPPRESFGFIKDIESPLEYHFRPGRGCDAGVCAGCMKNGAEIRIEYPQTSDFPETAFMSLRRVLKAKNIPELAGTFPLTFRQDVSLGHEEYQVTASPEGVTVAAADPDGLRRAVYFLEDRICEAEGASVTPGQWKRKPFIRHRVSRCFFGPTNRAPFFIDELTNDVDYYPEEYLNKLAHEGVNGLWLTMYFRDLPSSVFPGRGKDAEKRFAKLRLTVERCARYGIRIYVFLSEPKLFGNTHFSVPFEDAKDHPEIIGAKVDKFGLFCVSTEAGKRYLAESMEQIFKAVPNLGGVINIMLGEDNGSCVAFQASHPDKEEGRCPVCSKRDFADIFCELAELYSGIMHKYNPAAEYIGWFYAPGQRDDSEFMKRLLHIAEKWPDCATLMFNFESGGAAWQLNKKRIVFDYSLAYVGPSKLFAESTAKAPRMGAKLQVGCSHENAAVPFIPVPENLYDKYKFMHEHGVSAAMQCWYFGNYPGLMNKAAGELSFEPFASHAQDFLTALARPDWGKNAPKAAAAWNYFSQAYRQFPANLSFEWFGPLHHCIAWPLHLFPVDEPISPSWILKNFPEVSGDRIGECLGYHHTLSEALELCTNMSDTWQKGVELFEALRSEYSDNPPRLADINLAKAAGLQMKSTKNLLRFYFLREDMIYSRKDHLAEMKAIVEEEIVNSQAMLDLCRTDCRLGYHSEAEGYLFFPEKLRARIQLLHELLDEDFPRFDLNAEWIGRYTGSRPEGASARCFRRGSAPEERHDMGENTSWSASYDDRNLYLSINGVRKSIFSLVIEPCRLWTPFRIDFRNGEENLYSGVFRELPKLVYDWQDEDLHLTVPLDLFEGFRREGFPMRMNIFCRDHFHWVDPQLWPSRLQHGDFNPAGTGWLIFA